MGHDALIQQQKAIAELAKRYGADWASVAESSYMKRYQLHLEREKMTKEAEALGTSEHHLLDMTSPIKVHDGDPGLAATSYGSSMTGEPDRSGFGGSLQDLIFALKEETLCDDQTLGSPAWDGCDPSKKSTSIIGSRCESEDGDRVGMETSGGPKSSFQGSVKGPKKGYGDRAGSI
jgi:hypothetical protein